jgi:hypothetical protein
MLQSLLFQRDRAFHIFFVLPLFELLSNLSLYIIFYMHAIETLPGYYYLPMLYIKLGTTMNTTVHKLVLILSPAEFCMMEYYLSGNTISRRLLQHLHFHIRLLVIR